MMCFGLKERKRPKTNHCVIVLLDDTQLVHELHPTSTGQDLLDVVFKHLNLLETSYFGLRYNDSQAGGHSRAQKGSELYACGSQLYGGSAYSALESGQRQRDAPVWLDVEKSAIKQLRDVSPMTVYFGIKYYATDPCKLAEEITRYQFFLQCKQDILNGRMQISFDLAVELFGLAIQSELGDYDPMRHSENYASEFQFVPNQTLELEQRAALFHRQLIGQVPATAELNFLERVKWLDLYGCQMHLIQYDEGGHQGDLYALGLNPTGVLVLRNRLRVAQYLWSRIVKTKCQGRCFLMDVIETSAAAGASAPLEQQRQANGGLLLTTAPGEKKQAASAPPVRRNRFGFRLADKESSRRLRWAIEEHKHFYHLIHSSATFNQLARQQRQQQQAAAAAAALAAEQLKLSQRFRNSIRSAINIGGAHSSFVSQQQQQAQLAYKQQQQRLRSSVKSLNHNRQQPAVVRTPSRRYSNRSLPRPSNSGLGAQQHYFQKLSSSAANGNGLPAPGGLSSTMVPDQRQQAMLMLASQQQLMMSALQPDGDLRQLGQPFANKAHTLKPVSSREAKQRAGQPNPYYQMMLMMAQQQQQYLHAKCAAEVSVLPPGQHIVQPSIYKATSVVDGINQLADAKLQHQSRSSLMQQFFSTQPQYASAGQRPGGHESPKSTRSALAAGGALKMASRKLMKQQQLLLKTRAQDARPLLAEGGHSRAGQAALGADLHYSNEYGDFYSMAGAYSASASPRSARSLSSRWRSKSTGENLHVAHQQQLLAARLPEQLSKANSKLLLTTAALPRPPPPPPPPVLLPGHTLPPPDYNSSRNGTPIGESRGLKYSRHSDLESVRRKQLNSTADDEDEDDDDEYEDEGDAEQRYCSRSDCSSVEGRFASSLAASGKAARKARPASQTRDTTNERRKQPASYQKPAQREHSQGQSDWQAIRRRHGEFSRGEGVLNQQVDASRLNGSARADLNNNCSGAQSAMVTTKNITNKQATPILLSMGQHLHGSQDLARMGSASSSANSKAVQLLNMQRQQLNASTGQPGEASHGQLARGPGSNASSANSSPKLKGPGLQTSPANSPKQLSYTHLNHHNAADSTASNSTTTSGYYAGSNSTEHASADSDAMSPDGGPSSASVGGCGQLQSSKGVQLGKLSQQTSQASTRAKLALSVHGPKVRGLGGVAPGQARKQDSFYLGTQKSGYALGGPNSALLANEPLKSTSQHHEQQWAQLEQFQHGPASLKYVSFDV